LLVGGKNLTGDVYSLQEEPEQVLEEFRPIGATGTMDQYMPIGVSRTKLDAPGGLYDSRTFGQLAALQEMGQTSQLVCYGFAGCVPVLAHVGAKCIMQQGDYVSAFKRVASKSGLTLAHGTHTLTGVRDNGRILHGIYTTAGADAGEVASGDTELLYHDNGGEVSLEGAEFKFDLHVSALGAGTTLTVNIRHSDAAGGPYVTLETFAAVVAAGASERITHSVVNLTALTHVQRYIAVSWTLVAGVTTATFAVAFHGPVGPV